MRFKKIALALVACLALTALAANGAQASGEGWAIGTTENQTTVGTLIASGTHQGINCGKHGGSTLVFTATLLNESVEITTGGVDCLKEKGSTNPWTIDNTTFSGHGEGVLTFTEVKVLKPSIKCSVPGDELTTEKLTDKVFMDPTSGSTVVFDRFFPETSGGDIARIKFEGPECPFAGDEAAFMGNVCGESINNTSLTTPNATGTLTVTQTLVFGKLQQTTGSSKAEPCELTFGGKPALFSGAIDQKLAGTNVGKPFGD